MKPQLRLPAVIVTAIAIVCGCQSKPAQRIVLSDQGQGRSNAVMPQATATANAQNRLDPLSSLNSYFLEAYRDRQLFVKTNIGPVIVANFSTLVLYWNGQAETNRCIPEVYQALKAVDHVPFCIFLRLQGSVTAETNSVAETVLAGLNDYLKSINTVESSLLEDGFSPEQLSRARAILDQSRQYLNNIVVSRKISRQELLDFARRLGPSMLANADDAAKAQIDMTHAVVMQWKEKIAASDWKRLTVVVRGPQMPRRMNILTQYFARVLDEPSHGLGYPLESRHLIYAETIFSNRDALDLMATTFIDGDASEAFFGDRLRMSRDVLADGAAAYLQKLHFE